MHLADLPRRLRARPAWGCAAVAAALRVLLVLHQWDRNPFVRDQQLDGEIYLRWAADVARGDVLGRGGFAAGEPWLLNPLYAYVLAPFVAFWAQPLLPVLVFQALLGAGTVALSAAAATRTFGRGAGWVAGLLVAFATPLAHLDAHLAVAELAAFLVAGACFACAPAGPRDRPWAHGPVAAGLWLGIGALARPVTPLALPFVAWRFARAAPPGRRVRGALLVAAAFGACAAPSFLRNRLVGGEAVVWTAAGGVNIHLGINPEARAYGLMTSPYFRFHPVSMHADAKALVAKELGREPTRGEISSWFWTKALDDVAAAPLASAVYYVHKARWFFGPREPPSSASLNVDRNYAPRIGLAFVPAWLIACLAAAGAWLQRRRADVLLGPGALALAHWAMLTLVFPLSHYRAPAIPALAVLAAGAFAAVVAAGEGRRARAALTAAAIAGALGVAGAVGPQPDLLRSRDHMTMGARAMLARDLAEAERQARTALAVIDEERMGKVSDPRAWQFLADVLFQQGRWAEAAAACDRALAMDPDLPPARMIRSRAVQRLGDLATAEADAKHVVATAGDEYLAEAFQRLGEVLRARGRAEDAARAFAESRAWAAKTPRVPR